MHETDFSHEHVETAAERTAIARTIWDQDNVAFTTVGIDVGSPGRDALYGPGLGTVDYSMFKNFPIFGERIKGQFRAEIFNLFNRTNWAPPNATLTSASFGEMTATRNASSAPGLGFAEPRNIQLALKIIY